MGDISVAAYFKNENCDTCTKTIWLESAFGHSCTKRELEDTLTGIGAGICVLAMKTVGALVGYFELITLCAQMLWKEV